MTGRIALACVITSVLSGVAVADGPPPATGPASAEITRTRPGPWGQLELVPIVLEMSDEFASADMTEQTARQVLPWTFTGLDRRAATLMMADCGVPAERIAAIPVSAWADTPVGCTLLPPDEFVLGLSAASRAELYDRLMTEPANSVAIDPAWFRAGRVDFRLRGSGLSDASVALVKRLLYPSKAEPDTLLLSDTRVALRAINDPAERVRFFKAVTRKRSLVARLLIDADADTTALAAYWGKGGRQDNLLPLLNSLKYNAMAGVERPGKINILTLLPPFIQERLYRHAEAPAAGRAPDDCFWTAFNFFNGTPDDRVHDMAYLAGLLKSDYVAVPEPGQLGDVIVLADEKGNALHAANYIADDAVLTKNGLNERQPWLLVSMADLVTQYRIRTPDLQVAYFRKR